MRSNKFISNSNPWQVRYVVFFMCASVASSIIPESAIGAGPTPAWSSDRQHRIIVEVDAARNVTRASDEMVARVDIDFDDLLQSQPADLGSLQVVGYSNVSGEVIEFPANSYATTRGDRPLRFYDAGIPWDFKDHEGYAQSTDGKGTPLREMPGGLRFFNPSGDDRKGQIVWAHTQVGSEPTTYAVYFNVREKGAKRTPAPAGFIGDGSNRLTRESDTFSPVYQGRVSVADMDGDGLFDLLMGNATGTILWYRNNGIKGQPKFNQPQMLFTENGEAIDVSWSSAPVATDWDHDGDLDLLVGAEKECVVYFENVGDARAPKFHLTGLLQSDGKPLIIPHAPCEEDPGNKIYPIDYYGVPEVTDWDGDGDTDLLIGGYITGRVWYYENTAASKNDPPQLAFRGAIRADGRDLDVGWCASPTVADMDGDGDLDLVSGAMQINPIGGDGGSPDKFLWYYENTGTRTNPKLTLREFPAAGQFPYGALATPRVFDFNADGLFDLVYSVNGLLTMLPNIGTMEQPKFDAMTPDTSNTWGNGQLGFNQLVDYNRDGWPDLFTGLSRISLNTGRGAPGVFDRTLPLSGAEKIRHPSPSGDHWDYRTLSDLDNDGDFDVLLGDHRGYVWLHRNDGSNDDPRIDIEGQKLMLKDGKPLQVGLPPADVAPFDVLQGARTAVTSGDFNHDGKTDVVASDTYGYFRVFQQIAGENPQFELAVEVKKLEPTRLTAQRADWNGDGWDDLIASYANDRLYVLVNRAVSGKAEFASPQRLNVPPCYGDPWPFVGDWNHDGDDDLIIDQYGYTRFVERSFIDHGYRPARIVRFESRPSGGAGQ
jgi:VCBS repeat protein